MVKWRRFKDGVHTISVDMKDIMIDIAVVIWLVVDLVNRSNGGKWL